MFIGWCPTSWPGSNAYTLSRYHSPPSSPFSEELGEVTGIREREVTSGDKDCGVTEYIEPLFFFFFNETVITFQAKVLEWSLRRLPMSSLQLGEGPYA